LAYNVAGIEMAYILKTFKKNSEKLQKYWLEKQFKRNYNFKKSMLCNNTDDSETLSARIYEATRLDNLELNLVLKEPLVSVIVPVYNDAKRIKICVEKLLNQSYPQDKYEIIIIDNNSSDNTVNVIKRYPVKILFEKNIQSSYAARNKGIKEAKGEIIAFTDSDCQPTEDWIKNGVEAMFLEGAGLIGGKVSFIFSDQKDPFEIYDSIKNMQQKDKVSKGHAATANLFVRKNIFEKMGFFPENVKSGGDVDWTSRAVSKGFYLIYKNTVRVFHPTRKKNELLRKQLRIGYGQAPLLIKRRGKIGTIALILRDFFPSLKWGYQKIRKMNPNLKKVNLLRVYLAIWICNIFTSFGRILYLKDRLFEETKK